MSTEITPEQVIANLEMLIANATIARGSLVNAPILAASAAAASAADEASITALNAEVLALEAEIERLKAQVPPSRAPIQIGANCNTPTDNSWPYFKSVEQTFGQPLNPARMFDGRTIALSGPAKAALAEGRPVAYSIAADVPSGIAGTYDGAVRSMAMELSKVPNSIFLADHEPEQPPKGISGPSFVKWQERFYGVVREVAPDLLVGPAHQSYQYEGPWANRGLDGSYLTSAGDFYGLDYYTGVPSGRKAGVPLSQEPGWVNWFKLVRPMAMKTGYPIKFMEYGVYHPDQSILEDILRQDADYIQGLNDTGDVYIDTLCLWLGSGNQGNWQTGLLAAAPLIRWLYEPLS